MRRLGDHMKKNKKGKIIFFDKESKSIEPSEQLLKNIEKMLQDLDQQLNKFLANELPDETTDKNSESTD